MVELKAYEPHMFESLQCLLRSQDYIGFDIITPDALPACGFMAVDDTTPVAVGFLRLVEGGYAQIDTLVSNKELSSQTRHDGISAVVDHLIKYAIVLKLKGILAFTADDGILKRANVLGFKVVAETIISLPL